MWTSQLSAFVFFQTKPSIPKSNEKKGRCLCQHRWPIFGFLMMTHSQQNHLGEWSYPQQQEHNNNNISIKQEEEEGGPLSSSQYCVDTPMAMPGNAFMSSFKLSGAKKKVRKRRKAVPGFNEKGEKTEDFLRAESKLLELIQVSARRTQHTLDPSHPLTIWALCPFFFKGEANRFGGRNRGRAELYYASFWQRLCALAR